MAKGRRPKPPGAAETLAPLPPRPAHLEGVAAAMWDRVAELRHDQLDAGDAYGLECLCQTFAAWRTATELLRTEGHVVRGKLHPASRVADAALKQVRGLLTELGLTPSSRGKVPAGNVGEGDPLLDFAGVDQ